MAKYSPDRERRRSWSRPKRRSVGRSNSIRTWRSRTSCTRSSRWISAARTMRWCASSGRARSADPEFCAGLVSTCRYCGLLEASVAAHALRASSRAEDPHERAAHVVPAGDYRRVASQRLHENPYIVAISLGALGRSRKPSRRCGRWRRRPTRMRDFMVAARTLLEGDPAPSVAAVNRIVASDFRDPEALFYLARHLSHLQRGDAGARALRTGRRGRLLLLSGLHRTIPGSSRYEKTLVHETTSSGRDPASRGCGGVR